jgi:hypothetical protein
MARLFDPLRESFGGERCTPCRADESFTQDPNGAPLRRDCDPSPWIIRRKALRLPICWQMAGCVAITKIPNPGSREAPALAVGDNGDMRVRH